MSSVTTLLDQFEKSLEHSREDCKGPSLCSIAEVMSGGSVNLTPEQLAQYDMLLCRFAAEIELAALSKLAFVLAHIENGLPKMVHSLSRHEDILVAGPILAGSPMLDDALLEEIVQSRPQSHLCAVCERVSLSEEITSSILEHGDESTTRQLAKNTGARFSDQGYEMLIERSKGDDELAARVAKRGDISERHLKLLMEAASDHVCKKLVQANPKIANMVEPAVANVARELKKLEPGRSVALVEAYDKVAELYRKGEVDSAALFKFASERKTDETLIALSFICRVDPAAASLALKATGYDTALMMAKVCDLTWPEAKTVIQAIKGRMALLDAERAMSQFARLNADMARNILRLRIRRKASKPHVPMGKAS